MIEIQQPYIPVCLMAAATIGTPYIHHLDHIRGFRDNTLYGRFGIFGRGVGGLYYELSRVLSPIVFRSPFLRVAVRDLIVRPLGFLARFFD